MPTSSHETKTQSSLEIFIIISMRCTSKSLEMILILSQETKTRPSPWDVWLTSHGDDTQHLHEITIDHLLRVRFSVSSEFVSVRWSLNISMRWSLKSSLEMIPSQETIFDRLVRCIVACDVDKRMGHELYLEYNVIDDLVVGRYMNIRILHTFFNTMMRKYLQSFDTLHSNENKTNTNCITTVE